MKVETNQKNRYFDDDSSRRKRSKKRIFLDETALMDRIKRWIFQCSEDDAIALYIIEIDELIKVRALLGEAAGELLLLQVVSKLVEMGRYPLQIARLDGGELGIAIKGLNGVKDAWDVVGWIEKQFEARFRIDGVDVYLSPRIGVSVIPYIASDQFGLLRTAYLALNKSRSSLVDKSHMYDALYAESLYTDLILESELRLALEKSNELVVHYQPKQHLKSQNIVGLEALIRWDHPQKGRISPEQFIPVAERTGLISQITDYVLDQVCSDLTKLTESGLRGRVSINISTRDLLRSDFVADALKILQRGHTSASRIELEITETTLINDFEGALKTLNLLREKGFYLALDDFGTGYCSLSYLSKLPVNIIKVDRSFVRDIESNHNAKNIFEALITLAAALDLKVVAEGVEKVGQKHILSDIGCEVIQGYLLSKPVPLKGICEYLSAFNQVSLAV